MQTVKEAVQFITEKAVERQQRPKEQKMKQVPKMSVGQVYRQGDLYIHRVPDNHPVGKQLDRRQLADGQSIGQRHVLLGEFKVYETTKFPESIPLDANHRKAAVGYTFDITGEARNAHPEHDHYIFGEECKGRYIVTHQLNLRTLERVRD